MNILFGPLLLAFISLLVTPAAEAVTYANTATTFNWIDASTHTKLGPTLGGVYSPLYSFSNTGGCGSTPPSIDDSMSSNLPIGFTFMYSGVNFTQVRIMSNGRLQFNNNITCGYGSPVTQLPYPNAGLNYTMRIYGGDLDPSLQSEIGAAYTTNCISRASCYVSYATVGVAPYRKFVATWNNVPEWTSFSSASGSYNVQLILQENGEFIYQYGANTPGPGNAVAQVGWQADINSSDYDIPAVGYPANNSALKFYIARPVAEYRMEQVSWNGTAGEVLDTSGNALHGTAVISGATTRPAEVATGQVCRGGQIANNTTVADISAIDTGVPVPTSIGSVGTITFWYNNASNTPNNTRVLFDASTVNNRWFYLTRTNTNALNFVVTDSGNTNRTVTTANNALPTTGWSHIAVSWNFNNLAAANSDRLRIWVNGTLLLTTAFTTTNVISTQIGTLYVGDNRSSVSPVGVSAGNPGGTSATLDEFRIYNYEGGLALIQRDKNQTGACLNHYAISHAGTGQTCLPTTITIFAHDVAHGLITMPNNTTMIQLSTSTGKGDWTLLNGYGVLNNGTANDGIATYLFNGEYQAVFGLTHSIAGAVNINVTDGQIVESASEDPLLTLSTCFSNLNACHDYTTSHCSAASGKLYTRLAGTSFATDAVALDGSDNVATSFTGKAVVSLVARTATGGTLDAQHCFTAPEYTQVLDNAVTSFTAGKLTVNGSVPNVYRDARIKLVCDATNCPPSGMTWCSTDNFAIRPASFTVTANLGGPKLAAGLNFSMTAASAYTNYTGTPVLNTANLRDHNSAAIGTMTGSFPAAISGSSTGITFQYHDVGTVSPLADAVTDTTFTAADQPSDCTNDTSNVLVGSKYGCSVGSVAAGPFGRFFPHHFTYAATLSPVCAAGGFTYMDQPNLGINLTLSAKSLNETTTTRYTSGYSTLGTFSITADNSGTAVAVSRLSPTLPAFAWNNGAYTVNSAITTFARIVNPDGPYDSFALQANILTEPDNVTISGTSLSFTTKIRYGRAKLSNAYGSELLSLTIPLTLQYFNGTGWATNTLDTCTTLAANNVAYAFSGNITACNTAGTLSGSAPNLTLNLSAPGLNSTGQANMTLNLGSTASGNTCTSVGGAGPAATAANHPWLQQGAINPTARATFGIYQGRKPFIYLRESY
jgi:hypothetical protein